MRLLYILWTSKHLLSSHPLSKKDPASQSQIAKLYSYIYVIAL